ncbi:hypothetical protein K435DRAFT_667696, partial [Dendrothele bispora CBS 962.96]
SRSRVESCATLLGPLLNDKSLPLVEEACDALKRLQWTGKINGFSIQVRVDYLAHLFTTKWLSSEHMDLFIELLRARVAGMEHGWKVELPGETATFIQKIIQAYNKQATYYHSSCKEFRWIQRVGQSLAVGQKTLLGLLANVRDTHWVAIIINTERLTIFHADSMGDFIDDELKLALQWWTYQHFGKDFNVCDMPVCKQQDMHSCGILAFGALEAFLSNDLD